MGNSKLFVSVVLLAVGCSSPDAVKMCLDGSTDCGGFCTDLMSDEANCGACNTACNYGSSCLAGVCGAIYGEPAQLPGTGSWMDGYLFGTAIDVSRPGSLSRFGILVPTTAAGSQVRMALYTDNAGNPASLVAQTSAATLVVGRQEFAVSPTALAAGRYWLMLIYDKVTPDYRASPAFGTTKYIALAFGSALPSTFPTTVTYPGGPWNTYIITSD